MVAALAACSRHEPAPTQPAPARPAWTTVYQAGSADPSGKPSGGTELRALVPFQGKLYAGLGYWKDTAADEPTVPGAQVLVLDGPTAPWRVDLALDDVLPHGAGKQGGRRRYQAIGGLGAITLTTNADGSALAAPARFLAAGPWSRSPGVDVFVRGASSPWVKSTFGAEQGNVRCFTQHVDQVTHISEAFAGSDLGIIHGTLDAGRGTIAWAAAPEPQTAVPDDWRVMSFAEAGGRLFATIGAAIFERADGPAPSWKRVYMAAFPPEVDLKGNGGLRGMTTLATPRGDVLLVAAGGPTARILRVDPAAGFAATVDVDVVTLLSSAWHTPIAGALLAYNDMLAVKDPQTGERLLVLGLEAHMHQDVQSPFPTWFQFRAEAAVLVRHANGTYDVHLIEDAALAKPPPRVAVRTLALSPFEPDVVYAGGFDANDHPAHETAWALKGPLATLLLH